MYFSRKDMRSRAIKFAKAHENSKKENSEAQTFLNDFFDVFGVDRRRYATFEKKVNVNQRIDLLWKQKILIEMKSRGENLDKAYNQAKDYFGNLTDEDIPNLIMVCDMQKFRVYDLENNKQWDFALNELEKNIDIFSTLYGGISTPITPQDPVNIKAAEKMGKLHNEMSNAGYTGHQLKVYMVRLMFCMFAEDTGIFEPATFFEYIKNSKENGEDLAIRLHQLFEILNKLEGKRNKLLSDELKNFPYINGDLFAEGFEVSSFNSSMRKTLLECCSVNWEKVSPAIFGSMFQSIMDKEHRRDLGAHYTSEENILKVIKPLFLDELYSEFNSIGSSKSKLEKFQKKLRELRFFDPACGCGNFLVIAYREIRRLEHEVIKKIYKGQQSVFADSYVLVNVEQFYGIEIEEFPARIAQVAMWLLDHQMNKEIGDYYGEHFARIPLKTSANIKNTNALTVDWKDVCPNADYILGNPPFAGSKVSKKSQKDEVKEIFDKVKGGGTLDYVACWYKKAADYIEEVKVKGKSVKCAFVSTNSICQGEQVGVLWGLLFENYNIHINFAYQTFKWSNEAKGKAAVSCIIVGFSQINNKDKLIFTKNGDVINAKNINQYLLNAETIFIKSRTSQISNAPVMKFGSKAVDFGHLILSEDEAKELISKHKALEKYIKKFGGGDELLYGDYRYCLWLADYHGVEDLSPLKDRIEKVKQDRLKSSDKVAVEKAKTPHLFYSDAQPTKDYIVISQTFAPRNYLPFDIVSSNVIANSTCLTISPVDYYTLGIIGSKWHIIWLDKIGGKLEERLRYSINIVYNNFPFSEKPNDIEKEAVVSAIKEVVAIREQLLSAEGVTIAKLYDPNFMPLPLQKAYKKLDDAVIKTYKLKTSTTEEEWLEFILKLYKKLISK